MHMLKSILHDNFIQGMQTPSVRAIQRVLQEQKSSFECSEVQVNFNLLCTLLGHSVDCRDAKTNSLGLIDLFQPGQVGKLASVANVIEGMAPSATSKYLSQQMDGVPLKGLHKASPSSSQQSRQRVGTELLFNYKGELDFKGFSWELLTRNHSADSLLFSTLFMSEQERH